MRQVNAQLQHDRRDEILAAAQRLFARMGFHQTSMQQICAAAGMSPGNLYRYFPSKEAIIAGIAERYPEGVHVNITSFNRAVLLTGEVPDAATREAIEKIAAGLPNARAVANELEVAGASSITSRSNDSLITSKVKVRLLDAKRVYPMHVKVVTEAGIVYLMGIVTEQEGSATAEVARTTGGVRKVVKVFEYCKPTDDACRPSAPASAPAQKAWPGG